MGQQQGVFLWRGRREKYKEQEKGKRGGIILLFPYMQVRKQKRDPTPLKARQTGFPASWAGLHVGATLVKS